MAVFRVLSLLLLGVLLVGCDSGGENDSITLTDVWGGSFTKNDTEYDLTVTLQQSQATDFGTASVTGEGGLVVTDADGSETTIPFSVNGTLSNSTLSLQVNYEDSRPGQLTGTVGPDVQTIEAVLVGGGPGFDSDAVTLNRGG